MFDQMGGELANTVLAASFCWSLAKESAMATTKPEQPEEVAPPSTIRCFCRPMVPSSHHCLQ